MTAAIPSVASQQIAVGDLIVDTGTHQVLRDGRELAVPKLSYQLLMALVGAAPDMVTTDDLAERVWSGRAVSNETITQRVKLLRDALGDSAAHPTYIGVVRGEGYRLLVEIRPAPNPDFAVAPMPRTRRRLMLAVVAAAAIVTAVWFGLRGGSPSGTDRPAVAVLPFLNLSDDPEQGYFADGLTEEIITELSGVPGLRVAGRTSSFAFKDRTPAFSEVGDALHVDHVLEGSVRWDGDTARITAQLITVADGFHLWSETFSQRPDDVFLVQQDIARAVTGAVSVQLGTTDLPAPIPTVSVKAYAEFLRGQALFWNHTPETTERAIEAYQQAVALEPGFARAWIGLGYAYGGRSRDPVQTGSALNDMAAAAQRALAILPRAWEALALQAWIEMSNHHFLQAERTMEQALTERRRTRVLLDSINCPIACYFQQLGRVSDGLAEARRMQDVDPLSPSSDVSSWLYLLGKRDEAIAAFQASQQLLPRPFERRAFDAWLALESADPAPMEIRLEGTPLAGKWGKPKEILPVLASYADQTLALPRGSVAQFAIFAAIHGDDELALQLLRQEYLKPGFGAYFLLWHPALQRVRSRDGFIDLVTEMGLVEAWRGTGRWGDYCSLGPDEAVTCS